MLSKEIYDSYEATIGVEIHVQFNTKTKLFSGVGNDARDAEPNTLVSPICFGLPGVLPVLNKEAIEKAVRAGIALNAEVAEFSKFDRKHYFYPDLPKGYQITQFDEPIVKAGVVTIDVEGEKIDIGITRAHLEEDAGKSMHPAGKDYSLVDLNRAGTPLLEIVSEPDIHSAAAAKAYAQEIYYRMMHAGVSNVDLYQGNMRFDVNVSVAKKGSTKLGTRSETKNLNSFKSVEKATEYEIKRQIEELEAGREIVQETRGWLDDKQKTVSQRSKEDAHDYRYFPEPDLPPIVITKQYIEEIRAQMPELPQQIRERLSNLGLQASQVETVLANIKFNQILKQAKPEHAKNIANWLTGPVLSYLSDKGASLEDIDIAVDDLETLSVMFEGDKLSSTGAKQVLEKLLEGQKSPEDIATKLNLVQTSDSSELEAIVDKVMGENSKAVNDLQNGEMKAIGFLTGQVMKASGGKANPKMVQEIIKKRAGEQS
jgi:aspartyl-tRNA(Asn)/glutamyl-tRNA(Gln) amidotransferase subunit B